ncbi:hypothetical protein BVY04_04155 [bacterium M21]|nr:hypothetical protein BVY04_04155 [bacterium M21]
MLEILIAEDEPTSAMLLIHMFEPLGRCAVVTDGKKAVSLVDVCMAEGTPFDLICLDIKMPTLDGWDVLRRIREIEQDRGVPAEKQVKVMMTTSRPRGQDDLDSDLESLYQGYLPKPYDLDQLAEMLKEMGIEDAQRVLR